MSVRDQGEGIPPEMALRVFRQFWRGKRRGGTGLGLYIVKGLIEAMDGEIAVAPRARRRRRVPIYPARGHAHRVTALAVTPRQAHAGDPRTSPACQAAQRPRADRQPVRGQGASAASLRAPGRVMTAG